MTNIDIRERMYQIYNDQIPLLNSKPVHYNIALRSHCAKFIPIQAGAGYVDQPGPANYFQNEGTSLTNQTNQGNLAYSFLDYADWVEYTGRQIAASNNKDTISKGTIQPVDKDGNIITSKASKLQKLIAAKKASMGGCSECHLKFDIDPVTHQDNIAFKLGSALDRNHHVKKLNKIVEHLRKNHGGSMKERAKIFHNAYTNVHGNDYDLYKELLNHRINKYGYY